MVRFGECIHCGVYTGVATEELYFNAAGTEVHLQLCVDCRATLLADDDITRSPQSLDDPE